MDLQAEINWIQKALSESNDPTFVEAVKNMIQSIRKQRKPCHPNRCRKIY